MWDLVATGALGGRGAVDVRAVETARVGVALAAEAAPASVAVEEAALEMDEES